MRLLFTVVSLLLVLVVIGMLAKTQLGSLRGAAATATSASGPALPAVEQKIKDDVTRLMQNAPQRSEPPQ